MSKASLACRLRARPRTVPVVLTGLLMAFAGACREPPAPQAGRFFKVQLHLHGSLSEGTASMRSQAFRAREFGYDALWWTDHDWRIARHTHFEVIPLGAPLPCTDIAPRGAAWSPAHRCIEAGWSRIAGRSTPGGSARAIHPEAAESAVELRAQGSPKKGAASWVQIAAEGGRLRASLFSRPLIRLHLHGWERGKGGKIWLRIQLSEQPEGRSELWYSLGESGAPQLSESPGVRRAEIPTPIPPGTSVLELDPAEDAERMSLGGTDNNLCRLELGVQTAGPEPVSLAASRIEIVPRRHKLDVLRAQERFAKRLQKTTEVAQHLGLELSYSHHLVALLAEPHLPDFSRFPNGMPGNQAVDWISQSGGVSVYAHIFGAGKAANRNTRVPLQARLEAVLGGNAFGANLLEVGYRQRVLPLQKHLEVWDTLGSQGRRIIGIGVNDSHSAESGWASGNNFATWVWATSTESRSLLDGLLNGRVFFGPGSASAGWADLYWEGRSVMGQVLNRHGPAELELRFGGLPEDGEVRWILDGKPAKTLSLRSSLSRRLTVENDGRHTVRAEIWSGDEPILFTNCAYLWE